MGRIGTTRNEMPQAIAKGTLVCGFLDFVHLHPLLCVSLLSLPVYLLGLAAPALNDGEAMYAEIAREMRIGHDWITPHLNGTRHFDKPPLLYWLIALTQILLGESEFSARFVPALAAWATIPVVGAIGRALFGGRMGWLSALVFATSVGPFIFGRMIVPDPSMGFWIALSLLAYIKAYLRDSKHGNLWACVMFAAIGFASLIKGILGMGLPAAIIGLHVLVTGQLRSFLLSPRFLLGLAVLAAVVLPWNIGVGMANPDFFGYFIIREHILRFTGKRWPPDEFLSLPVFLTLTLLWTFPWVFAVPAALWRAFRKLLSSPLRNPEYLLLCLWIGVIVGLFSASKSRLEYYALTSLPAFSVLIARLWDRAFEGEPNRLPARGMIFFLTGMASIAAILAVIAFIVLGPSKDLVFKAILSSWPESGWIAGPEQTAALERIRFATVWTMAGVAVFTVSSLVALKKFRFRLACGLLSAMMIPLFAMIYWGFLVMEPFMSSRPIAEIVNRHTMPGDILVFQEPHEYMWVGGITFYTKRLVHILKDPKFEGVAARRREPPERFLDREEFLNLWLSNTRVLLVADETSGLDTYLASQGVMKLKGKAGGRMVMSNE